MAKSYIGAGQDQPIQAGFAGADQFARMAEREVQQRRDEDAKAQSLLKANRKVLDDLSDASTIKYEDLDARTIKMARNAQNRYQTKEYEIKRALERNPNDPRLLDEYDRNQQMLDAEIGALYNFKDYAGAIQSGIAENKFNQITGAQYLNNNTEMMKRLQSGEFDDAVPTDFFSAYREAVPMSKMPAYIDYQQISADFAKDALNEKKTIGYDSDGTSFETVVYNYDGAKSKKKFLSENRDTPYMRTMQGVIGNAAYYDQKEGIPNDRNQMVVSGWAHIDNNGDIAVSDAEVFKYVEDNNIKPKTKISYSQTPEKDDLTAGQKDKLEIARNRSGFVEDVISGADISIAEGKQRAGGGHMEGNQNTYDDRSGRLTYTIGLHDKNGNYMKDDILIRDETGKNKLGSLVWGQAYIHRDAMSKTKSETKEVPITISAVEDGRMGNAAVFTRNLERGLKGIELDDETYKNRVVGLVKDGSGLPAANAGVKIIEDNLSEPWKDGEIVGLKGFTESVDGEDVKLRYEIATPEGYDKLTKDIGVLVSISKMRTARGEQGKIEADFKEYLKDRNNYNISPILKKLEAIKKSEGIAVSSDLEGVINDMYQRGSTENEILEYIAGETNKNQSAKTVVYETSDGTIVDVEGYSQGDIDKVLNSGKIRIRQ